jgi:heterodisulfide reductase subunit C
MGLKDAVLRSKTLCLCISCESCTARCPNGIHVDALIDALRIRARKEGVEPAIPIIRTFHRAFLKPIRSGGKVFELGLVIRLKLATFQFFKDSVVGAKMFFKGKLGLTPSRIEGRDEVRRIFEETIDKE